MAELDELVGAALKRVAAPGDSAGVADAIRSRLAAGDTGTPAAPPIFRPRRWWMLWLGLAIVVAVLLGIGGTLAFGRPSPPVTAPTPSALSTSSPSPSPTPTRTPTATPAPPAPEPVEPEPEPAPEPGPPPDTTAPVIHSATASPGTIYSSNGTPSTVSATVTDDIGVVAVTISWSGYINDSASMQPTWSYTIDPDAGPPVNGTLTVVLQAFDAAGNASAPYQLSIPVTP